MKLISEMDYYELSHIPAKELGEMESWQQAVWCQRIYEFEEEKRKKERELNGKRK